MSAPSALARFRRTRELSLGILAILITGGGYALLGLSKDLPPTDFTIGSQRLYSPRMICVNLSGSLPPGMKAKS